MAASKRSLASPRRIAQRRRLDETLECGHEPGISLGNGPASTTGTANLPLRQRLRVEIVLATIDPGSSPGPSGRAR